MSLLGNKQGKNREISPGSKQVQKGTGRESEVRAGRVRTGRSGIHTENQVKGMNDDQV